jgi:rhodanese-related sulfurtransferase
MKIFRIFHSVLGVLLIFFLVTSCSSKKGVQDIIPAEAEKLMHENISNPQFIILDVRTPGEFVSGHLAGAINVDFNADDFEMKIGQLNKDGIYLVYCRAGLRSSKAVTMMKDKGFKSLNNLDGGISNWIEGNLPVVTE